MDAKTRRRNGLSKVIMMVWNSVSDGIVVMKHGNACGAKAVSQLVFG